MEEFVNNEDDEKKEIIANNEYEGVVHRDVTEDLKTWDTLDKVIEECLDYISPIDIEKGVNNEDDAKKEITADNEYEGVIHRDITDYDK